MELRLAVVVGPCPPLSSVVSPPHSVGGLSRSRPLPGGLCGARVDGRSLVLPGRDVDVALLGRSSDVVWLH